MGNSTSWAGQPHVQCRKGFGRSVVGMWPWLTLGHWHGQGLGFPGTSESSSESRTGLGRRDGLGHKPCWGAWRGVGRGGAPPCDREPFGRDSHSAPGLRRGLLSKTPPGTCMHTHRHAQGPQTPTDTHVRIPQTGPPPPHPQGALTRGRPAAAQPPGSPLLLSPQVTQLDQRLGLEAEQHPAGRGSGAHNLPPGPPPHLRSHPHCVLVSGPVPAS